MLTCHHLTIIFRDALSHKWKIIPYVGSSQVCIVVGEAYRDKNKDLFRPAFKMLNPIGGLGVFSTMAEKNIAF